MKRALVNAVKRAHRDPNMIACLIWDASKWAWSYTITQVAPEELAKPWHEQQHKMLVTRSGLFKGAQLSWHAGCKEAWPPHRALVRDYQFLVGKHPFIAAGDHRNITYIMNKKHRPQILRKTAHDRLDRMCLKWTHENFQIYTVPGVQSTFNDFHSRDGAPDDEPFYTLAEHAERILAKEQALDKLAGDAEGEKSEVSRNEDKRVTATHDTEGVVHDNHIEETGSENGTVSTEDGADKYGATNKSDNETPDDDVNAAAGATGDDSNKTTTPVHVVQQHLLITEPMPVPSDMLQKHECNMAGESLLPNLKPHDWPSVQQIAQAQVTMPAAARQTMRSVETAVPGVSLLTNADGKIVIPADHTHMVSIICATAHQGHHGHVKEKAMRDTIKECFWWAGMNKDIKEWAKKCLLCVKLAGGDIIPRPMGY